MRYLTVSADYMGRCIKDDITGEVIENLSLPQEISEKLRSGVIGIRHLFL